MWLQLQTTNHLNFIGKVLPLTVGVPLNRDLFVTRHTCFYSFCNVRELDACLCLPPLLWSYRRPSSAPSVFCLNSLQAGLPVSASDPSYTWSFIFLKYSFREFPGGPVLRTPYAFTAEGLGSIPGGATKTPQAAQCGNSPRKEYIFSRSLKNHLTPVQFSCSVMSDSATPRTATSDTKPAVNPQHVFQLPWGGGDLPSMNFHWTLCSIFLSSRLVLHSSCFWTISLPAILLFIHSLILSFVHTFNQQL